jgi:cytochrome c
MQALSPTSVWLATSSIAFMVMLLTGAPALAHQGGMQQEMVDLSSLMPDQEVAALRYCDGVYHVTNGEGDALEFPEFNLRFKTDASDMGPPQGTPALLPAAMMGDRVFVIFAVPEEISAFIDNEC